MKPRRLHSATILSIVTTSAVVGASSVTRSWMVLEAPSRGLEVSDGLGFASTDGLGIRLDPYGPAGGLTARREAEGDDKETALDISAHMCLHTLCSLADRTA